MNESKSEPTVDDILAEVERRRAARQASPPEAEAQLPPAARQAVVTTDRFIFWFTRHWLAVANTASLLYVGLPFLAPVLMYLGLEGPARIIYSMYTPLCHQLPYRSWYLLGAQFSYTMAEMGRLVGSAGLVEHGYLGDPTLGYKVAFCQRDTAIYGCILLAGLIYGMTRRKLRPMPLWAYLAFGLVPIGLDGGIQMFSAALPILLPSLTITPIESTPLRRVITGSLFGLATVWLAYPHLQEAALDMRKTLTQRFGWK